MKKVFAVISTLLLTIACIGLLSSNVNASGALFTDPVEAGALEKDEIPVYIMDSIYTTFPQYYDNNAVADEAWPGSTRMYPWNEVKLRVAQLDENGEATGMYYAIFFSGALNATDSGAGNNIMLLDAEVAEDGTVTAVSKRTSNTNKDGYIVADHPQDQSLSHISVNISDYDLEIQPTKFYVSSSTSTGYGSQIMNRSVIFDGEGRAIRGVGVNEFYVAPTDSAYKGYGFEAEFCYVDGVVTRYEDGVVCDKVKEQVLDEEGNPVMGEDGQPLMQETDKDNFLYERFVWEWFEEQPENVNTAAYLSEGWDPTLWDYCWEQDGGYMCIAFNGSAGTLDSMTAAQKAAYMANNGLTEETNLPKRDCISYVRVPAGGVIYDFGYLDNGLEGPTTAFFNILHGGYKHGRQLFGEEGAQQGVAEVKTVNFSAKPIYTADVVKNGQSLQLKEGTNVIEVLEGTNIYPSWIFNYAGLAKMFTRQDDVTSYSSDTSVLEVTVKLNGATVVSPIDWPYNDATVQEMYRDLFDDLRHWYKGDLTIDGAVDENGEPLVIAYSDPSVAAKFGTAIDDLDAFIDAWCATVVDSWGLFNGSKTGFFNNEYVAAKWLLYTNYMDDLMNGAFWSSAWTSAVRMRNYYQGTDNFPSKRNGAVLDKTPQVATEPSYNFTVGAAPSRYSVEYTVVNSITGVTDSLTVLFQVVNEYTPIIDINEDALIVEPGSGAIDRYNLFVAYDGQYSDASQDIRGTVITEQAVVTSETLDFDNPAEGKHQVKIEVTSLGGTKKVVKYATVEVLDMTAPLVVAKDVLNVPYGSAFDARMGIEVAYDTVDGDLMQSGVQWWSDQSATKVDTSKAGKDFKVKVAVFDAAGNETTVQYTVKVGAAPATLEEIQGLLEDKLVALESLENIELKLEEINSYVKPSGCKSKSLFFVEFLAVAGALALILRKKH